MPPSRKFRWGYYLLALVVILFLMFAPLISVFLAGGVASAAGCDLDEGSIHRCLIAGQDYGETLYTLFVIGWFSLLTLPAGALVLLLWLIVLVIHRLHWRKHALRARIAGA